jgi:archaellum component FlaC
MNDEPTEKLPGDVPDTEPTVLTLMERLRSMQETMDRRHLETQGWVTSIRDDINGVRGEINGVRDDINGVRGEINGVRDDINGVRGEINGVRDDINGVRGDINGLRDEINQKIDQKHELVMSRIDLLRAETEAQFRKQGHLIHVLSDSILQSRGDQRELFERIAALEEKGL